MELKKRKKILICGSYHGGNYGDLAILDSILKNIAKSKFQIKVATFNPSGIREKLSEETLKDIKLVHFLNIPSYFWSIFSTNILMIGGGGLFFDKGFFDVINFLKGSQLLVWLISSFLGKLTFKKVYWIGVGIGPFSGFGSFCMNISKLFVDKVLVRDDSSHVQLKNLGYKNAERGGDWVFLLKNDFKMQSGESKDVLLTFVSKPKYDEKYRKFIKNLQKNNPDHKFTLFSTNPKSDNTQLQQIAEGLELGFIDVSNLQIDEFYSIFDRFGLIISMRMHGLMIGLQAGLPGIGIESSISNQNYVNKVAQFQKAIYGDHAKIIKVEDMDNIQIKLDGVGFHFEEARENYLREVGFAGRNLKIVS